MTIARRWVRELTDTYANANALAFLSKSSSPLDALVSGLQVSSQMPLTSFAWSLAEAANADAYAVASQLADASPL